MIVLRQIRSVAAFVLVLLWFVPSSLWQRFVVWPAVLLMPQRRQALMAGFMRMMSLVINACVRLGGARIETGGRIPTEEPLLILANHQSLIDVTSIMVMCRPFAPWFVTRARYGRFVPAVSLCVRTLQTPIIDPHDRKAALEALRLAARRQRHGILIFPEGHRTRDGSIQEFKIAGALTMLKERRVPVYLAVTDGFWVCRSLPDFIFNMYRIDGRTEVIGPFHPPTDEAALPTFLQEMRQAMIDHLATVRAARAAS